ncbi:putative tubulin polyglutamylase ttll9 [Perkinsus chesapeaki]|uniref:Putative tubulin polyglutamylase ttll9 n=1 Tax=Perkinsus chesapeaki TaxID=330153 RepID=A0A7J6LJ99_PERCH|nr:putative tubulin polyglutamylase ttll9 [Perkinsus chesapeaki]
MDGVICDFELALMEQFQREHPDEPYISVDEREGFYCSKQYEALKPRLGGYVKDIISSEGFISHLPPISGALQSLRWLDELPDVEIWLCSTPLTAWRNCVPEKYEWVEKNLGTDFVRKLILTKDKTIIKADALIDDKPEITGSEEPPLFGRHVMFTQPYNQHIRTGDRLDGWFKSRQEAVNFVARIKSGQRLIYQQH